VNSEAIYSTRPWTTYGSGPSTGNTAAAGGGTSSHHVAEAFNERNRKELTAADVRYTKKGSTLYAFSMGTDAPQAVFAELAKGKAKVSGVTVLGLKGKVEWSQTESGLTVKLPSQKPGPFSVVCRIETA